MRSPAPCGRCRSSPSCPAVRERAGLEAEAHGTDLSGGPPGGETNPLRGRTWQMTLVFLSTNTAGCEACGRGAGSAALAAAEGQGRARVTSQAWAARTADASSTASPSAHSSATTRAARAVVSRVAGLAELHDQTLRMPLRYAPRRSPCPAPPRLAARRRHVCVGRDRRVDVSALLDGAGPRRGAGTNS